MMELLFNFLGVCSNKLKLGSLMNHTVLLNVPSALQKFPSQQ